MSPRSAQRTRKNKGGSRGSKGRDSQKTRSRTMGGNVPPVLTAKNEATNLMTAARKTVETAYDLELMLAKSNVKNTLNKQTSKGLTALHQAVLGVALNLTRNVTSKGKNGRGQSAVNMYYNNKLDALDNQLEKIRVLIAAGADKSLKDAEGNTPVDLAMRITDNQTKDKVLEALGFSSEVNAMYA
jgi:hypothetical protein